MEESHSHLSVIERFAIKKGMLMQTHHLVTDDGYVLKLFRITSQNGELR